MFVRGTMSAFRKQLAANADQIFQVELEREDRTGSTGLDISADVPVGGGDDAEVILNILLGA